MAVKTPETHTALVRRARKINRVLADTYPEAHCELDFQDAFQLLVSTVLSAQTTDKRVNMTTPTLFAKYPTAEDLAAANPEDVAEILKPTGFFNAKTKSVMGLSAALTERFGGKVPNTLEELVTLPGVGRKTAACVLLFALGMRDVPVDTHVSRVGTRLGLFRPSAPFEKMHDEMLAITPPGEELEFHLNLLRHGRRTCHARHPDCAGCALQKMCPSAFKVG